MTELELLESLKRQNTEMRDALDRTARVLNGSPWVIQLAPGAYLTPRGEGYGAGSVLRTACYSPERIDGAVAHVLQKHGDVFPNAKKMHRRDALAAELAASDKLIAVFEARTKAEAAAN